MNSPPAKAGGFGLRLSAQTTSCASLKNSSLDKPTLNSLLLRLCTHRHVASGDGRCCRTALDDRGMLPARKERFGARSLRGPFMAWLASSYVLGHGGSGISGKTCSRSTAIHSWQTGQNEAKTRRSLTIAIQELLTTSELKHLIEKTLAAPAVSPAYYWAWSQWPRRHQRIAAMSHRKTRKQAQL